MPKSNNIRVLAEKMAENARSRRDAHPVQGFIATEGFLYVPVDRITPNPDQPRKHFDKTALEELTASVKEKGILQPILVRHDPAQKDQFIIIAGERRWRAAKASGLREMPALVRASEDALEVALIENVQRQNLTALEEAKGLHQLKEARGYTLEQLGKIIGKSKQSVGESLKLLELPDDIQAEVRRSTDVRTSQKSQLLQVVRAGSPEKLRTAWEALKTGEITTVRDLRKKTAKPAGGRPKHYRFEHKPDGKPYAVTVAFTKKTASRAEVRGALKDALKHLP